MLRRLMVPLLAAGAVTLAGCYDEPGVTLHEPGVYKGDQDPLLGKIAAEGHHEELADRFRTVQTDR